MRITLVLVFCVVLCSNGATAAVPVVAAAATFVAEKAASYAITKIADEIFKGNDNAAVEAQVLQIDKKLQKIEKDMLRGEASIVDSIASIWQSIRERALNEQLHELTDLISRISAQAINIRSAAENSRELHRDTLKRLAEWNTSPNTNAIQSLLDRIHFLIAGSSDTQILRGRKSLLEQVADFLRDNWDCHYQKSAKQMFWLLYKTIVLTELRGYMMIRMSWMYLEQFEGAGAFKREQELLVQRFRTRTNHTVAVVDRVMESLDDLLYTCEPEKQVEGLTYQRVPSFIQGVVMKYCLCDSWLPSTRKVCLCDPLMSRRDCRGLPFPVYVCESEEEGRRYEFVDAGGGYRFGRKGVCKKELKSLDYEDPGRSTTTIIAMPVSHKLCPTTDNVLHNTTAYFSLKMSAASVDDNKIVTGLRFQRVDSMIHIQVQEGVLGPEGSVNESVQWKGIPRIVVGEAILPDGFRAHVELHQYMQLDLTQVKAPLGYVVTGVQFHIRRNHLHLCARVTKPNFKTGQLLLDSTEVLCNYQNNLTEILLDQVDVPTNAAEKSLVDISGNKSIKFQPTGFLVDAAQTVVPFLNIMDVVPSQVMPLSGVGLLYKGVSGFGGYVAPLIRTYDIFTDFKKHWPPV